MKSLSILVILCASFNLYSQSKYRLERIILNDPPNQPQSIDLNYFNETECTNWSHGSEETSVLLNNANRIIERTIEGFNNSVETFTYLDDTLLLESKKKTNFKYHDNSKYVYDTNGLLIEKFRDEFEIEFDTIYSNKDKISYTHDQNELLVSEERHLINIVTGNLEPYSKMDYVYNKDGQLDSLLTYLWEFSEWTESRLETYGYENEGNLILEENWRATTPGNYSIAYYVETRYNNEIGSEDLIQPIHFFEPMKTMVTGWTLWQLNNNDFEPTTTAIYEYARLDLNSIDDASPLLSLKVYPNPFENMIYINGIPSHSAYHLELWDSQGRQVIDRSMTGNQISLDQLLRGLYYCRISYGNQRQFGRVVKE